MASLPDSVKQNTALILLPGSFSPETFYTKVAKTLIERGFETVKPTPLLSAAPQSNLRQPPAKIEDDTLYIREVISACLEQGKDVVLVMNSYSGFPATQALEGLPSRSNLIAESSDGKRNGAVVGLIYLSSFMPQPGDSLRSIMDAYLFEPLKSGMPGEYMMGLPDEVGPAIFPEFASEGKFDDIKYWHSQSIAHSSDSYSGKVTYDAWKEGNFAGKTVYILGEQDMIVPAPVAESMIEKVGKDKVKVLRNATGGHCMHVTKPEYIVESIEDLLKSLA